MPFTSVNSEPRVAVAALTKSVSLKLFTRIAVICGIFVIKMGWLVSVQCRDDTTHITVYYSNTILLSEKACE